MESIIDTRGFSAFLQDLQRISGADLRDVLLSEVARVLEICVKRSPGKFNREVKEKTYFRVTKPDRYVNAQGSLVPRGGNVPRSISEFPYLQTMTGQRGSRAGVAGQWLVDKSAKTGNRVFLSPFWHISNARWATLQQMQAVHDQLVATLQPKAEASVAAIGSIKKSWLQIADRLGAELRLPDRSFVRRAVSPFDDGDRSTLLDQGYQVVAELVNTNAMLIKRYDGGTILQGAIDTRLKAFEYETANKVFDNIALRAKRHPGVFIK